jgi:hypothetical protein
MACCFIVMPCLYDKQGVAGGALHLESPLLSHGPWAHDISGAGSS